MTYVVWGVQVLLGLAFFGAGAMKASQPIDELAANGMTFVTYTPAWLVRFIGASEILGGIGLVLPAAIRVLPWLTPLAAASLALVMVLAAGTHAAHAEWGAIVPNVVLGMLALFVAWGRALRAPITAR